jgi:hypothetical protein
VGQVDRVDLVAAQAAVDQEAIRMDQADVVDPGAAA